MPFIVAVAGSQDIARVITHETDETGEFTGSILTSFQRIPQAHELRLTGLNHKDTAEGLTRTINDGLVCAQYGGAITAGLSFFDLTIIPGKPRLDKDGNPVLDKKGKASPPPPPLTWEPPSL